MARTWQDSPKATLQTRLGPVEATWTDNDHVSVRTDAHHNDDLPALTFRGRDWLVHFHLYASNDWAEGDASYGSVSQRGAFGRHDSAPRTFRAAIADAVIEAVRAHVAAHPEVLIEARRVKLNNDLIDAEEAEREAMLTLVTAREKVWALRAEESELTAAGRES